MSGSEEERITRAMEYEGWIRNGRLTPRGRMAMKSYRRTGRFPWSEGGAAIATGTPPELVERARSVARAMRERRYAEGEE